MGAAHKGVDHSFVAVAVVVKEEVVWWTTCQCRWEGFFWTVGAAHTGVDNSFADTRSSPSLESGMNRTTFPPKTSLEDGVPPHFLLVGSVA